MNQPPYPPYQHYYVQQPEIPAEKPKNTTMQALSIICNVAFMAFIGLAVLLGGSHAENLVVGLVGCAGFFLFAAGFIFLCLI